MICSMYVLAAALPNRNVSFLKNNPHALHKQAAPLGPSLHCSEVLISPHCPQVLVIPVLGRAGIESGKAVGAVDPLFSNSCTGIFLNAVPFEITVGSLVDIATG